MHTSLLRQRPRRPGLLRRSGQGLPLALAMLLAACGGGETASAPPMAQRLLAQTASETALTPVAATASSAERGDLSASAVFCVDGYLTDAEVESG